MFPRALLTLVMICWFELGQTTAQAPDCFLRAPKCIEDLSLSLVRENIRLCWVGRVQTFDEISDEWLTLLGEVRAGRARASGFPIRAGLRLIATSQTSTRLVSWPSDLQGLVNITSAEEALVFVRIFSSHSTFRSFPEFGYLEIAPAEPESPTDAAEISKGMWEQYDLQSPQVRTCAEGFRVLRSVARWQHDQFISICILDESVRADGAYAVRILFEEPIGERDASEIRLHFPRQECLKGIAPRSLERQ